MAKKVNPDSPVPPVEMGEDITKAVDNTPVEQRAPKEVKTNEPDDFVMQILRLYPSYKSLYVDRHGGVYTLDTAAPLRKGALLYDNPFYKSFKTNR